MTVGGMPRGPSATAPVFVVPVETLAAGPELVGTTVQLGGTEGRHAATVRRLQPGETLQLVDGQGTRASGVVSGVSREELTVELSEVRLEPPPQPRLVVVQALPKGDRGELAVELLTEVGVDVIVPWAAARCVAVWRGERGRRSLERWRATAREAGKQSRRSRLPEVTPPATTAEVADRLRDAAAGIVLHESADRPLSGWIPPPAGSVVVVVGPEGGVTDRELELFIERGAPAYRLGPTVLRTSTAGAAATAVLLAASGRWGT